MSTEAENRTEAVDAAWVDARPTNGEPVASENGNLPRHKAERAGSAGAVSEVAGPERAEGRPIDGRRVEGEHVDGQRVDGQHVDGQRIDGQRIDGERIDGEQVRPPLLEITVTADEAFARAMGRNEVRQARRSLALTAFVATMLIATSLGSTVAEAPWWTVFGMVGLASGFIVWVVVLGTLFQRHEPPPGLLDPTRYVFGLENLEWSTASTLSRLNWSAVREVRALRHGYQINREDGGTAVVICRTTLTSDQDARLRSYFSGLAATLAARSTTTGA